MSNETIDTRTKILQTAIDIVGLKGEVTIREITEKAGVNVASINYHFGNKTNLLKEVETHYSNLLYEMQRSILENDIIPPKNRLLLWSENMLDFIFSFPAVIGLIINLYTEDKSYNPALIKKIYLNNELQLRVKEIIAECIGSSEEKLLNYKYLQLFSGILGPVVNRLVSSTFTETKGSLDINNEEELKEYIVFLIDSITEK
ncbi:TetR/AcrR family transcriptional regulator [Clostridium polynesiense]|uniref:TetR/AcrR family transcriptional regulator n=1 Tax=Clostridium polynesiense TaxID=1325933 RepID=UPI00058F1112|nr:TetR/AcrR family transcriptional regulator [Clostridium polynesiense]